MCVRLRLRWEWSLPHTLAHSINSCWSSRHQKAELIYVSVVTLGPENALGFRIILYHSLKNEWMKIVIESWKKTFRYFQFLMLMQGWTADIRLRLWVEAVVPFCHSMPLLLQYILDYKCVKSLSAIWSMLYLFSPNHFNTNYRITGICSLLYLCYAHILIVCDVMLARYCICHHCSRTYMPNQNDIRRT